MQTRSAAVTMWESSRPGTEKQPHRLTGLIAALHGLASVGRYLSIYVCMYMYCRMIGFLIRKIAPSHRRETSSQLLCAETAWQSTRLRQVFYFLLQSVSPAPPWRSSLLIDNTAVHCTPHPRLIQAGPRTTCQKIGFSTLAGLALQVSTASA